MTWVHSTRPIMSNLANKSSAAELNKSSAPFAAELTTTSVTKYYLVTQTIICN